MREMNKVFTSKVVKLKRGHKHAGNTGDWNVALVFDWRDIPKDLSLTTRALNHWTETHSVLGYANFKTLREVDIISVLSCAKNRRQTILNIERQGRIAYYKVLKVNRLEK